jgi:integrase
VDRDPRICIRARAFSQRARRADDALRLPYILSKHVRAATRRCPSIRTKRVSPHVLRHTCAMITLQATGDVRKVALWLGHARMQTTEIYLRADPTEKLDAIDAVIPPSLRKGRFRPTDALIASLKPISSRRNAQTKPAASRENKS